MSTNIKDDILDININIMDGGVGPTPEEIQKMKDDIESKRDKNDTGADIPFDDNSDKSIASTVNKQKDIIGDVTQLETDTKELVGAINETNKNTWNKSELEFKPTGDDDIEQIKKDNLIVNPNTISKAVIHGDSTVERELIRQKEKIDRFETMIIKNLIPNADFSKVQENNFPEGFLDSRGEIIDFTKKERVFTINKVQGATDEKFSYGPSESGLDNNTYVGAYNSQEEDGGYIMINGYVATKTYIDKVGGWTLTSFITEERTARSRFRLISTSSTKPISVQKPFAIDLEETFGGYIPEKWQLDLLIALLPAEFWEGKAIMLSNKLMTQWNLAIAEYLNKQSLEIREMIAMRGVTR